MALLTCMPAALRTMAHVNASSSVSRGSKPGSRRANIDLPAPGGPIMSM